VNISPEELLALWKQAKKEGKRLLVGIDGQTPDKKVMGVQYRSRYGDTLFKVGIPHVNAAWYNLRGAPFTFVIGTW
jgi:hypothetical protein